MILIDYYFLFDFSLSFITNNELKTDIQIKVTKRGSK